MGTVTIGHLFDSIPNHVVMIYRWNGQEATFGSTPPNGIQQQFLDARIAVAAERGLYKSTDIYVDDGLIAGQVAAVRGTIDSADNYYAAWGANCVDFGMSQIAGLGFNHSDIVNYLQPGTWASTYAWAITNPVLDNLLKLLSVDPSVFTNAQGDFDADGQNDMIVTAPGGGTAIILGNGQAASPGVLPASMHPADGRGDYNGDGRNDILLHDNSDGSNVVWLMNGVNVQYGAYIGASAGITDAHTDYNGDGKSDIQGTGWNGDHFTWVMDGANAIAGVVTGQDPVIETLTLAEVVHPQVDTLLPGQVMYTLSELLQQNGNSYGGLSPTLLVNPGNGIPVTLGAYLAFGTGAMDPANQAAIHDLGLGVNQVNTSLKIGIDYHVGDPLLGGTNGGDDFGNLGGGDVGGDPFGGTDEFIPDTVTVGPITFTGFMDQVFEGHGGSD